MTIKIAHISDLHFSKWNWNPLQFFSKRWLGNLNYLLGRRKLFSHERLSCLPNLFKEIGITHVCVTGDLTTTSRVSEFQQAAKFIQEFRDHGLEVFCIPGNHDQYTHSAFRKQVFYDFFPSKWEEKSPFDLKNHGITTRKIAPSWWIVGMDTAIATSWWESSGLFSEKTEAHLTTFLDQLSNNENVILFNHFPFFQHEHPRKRLKRGLMLQKVIQHYPQVKIYCHGHTHRRCLADLSESGLPLICDPGSTPHHSDGSWYQLDLKEKIEIKVYTWEETCWRFIPQL